MNGFLLMSAEPSIATSTIFRHASLMMTLGYTFSVASRARSVVRGRGGGDEKGSDFRNMHD
jgi:hypothetical protein